MSNVQIFTPILPYVGRLPGELRYGSRIKFRGHFREPESAVHIILQREALLNPHEDVPLYITIHPGRKEIVRSYLCSSCSTNAQDERVGNCPIECGQDFELTIMPTAGGYDVVIHGTRFHTFGYRLPLASARFLFVSSGCIIFAITYENWNVTGGEQPQQPQPATAPPLMQQPRLLYPSLDHHQQHYHQSQQPRHALSGQHQQQQQQHHHHLRELILQALPLVQLAASQLQANSNAGNAGHALTGIETLSHLLPLFQSAATTDRKLAAKARRANRCAFWRSCGRLTNVDVLPAVFLACSIGIMRLFRFLVVAGVFGYIGYVFSRNT